MGLVDSAVIGEDLSNWDREDFAKSLLWNLGLLDHLSPLVDIGFEPACDFLRRARPGVDAERDQPLLQISVGKYILQRAVERRHDFRRRARGRKQRVPGDDIVIDD